MLISQGGVYPPRGGVNKSLIPGATYRKSKTCIRSRDNIVVNSVSEHLSISLQFYRGLSFPFEGLYFPNEAIYRKSSTNSRLPMTGICLPNKFRTVRAPPLCEIHPGEDGPLTTMSDIVSTSRTAYTLLKVYRMLNYRLNFKKSLRCFAHYFAFTGGGVKSAQFGPDFIFFDYSRLGVALILKRSNL